MMTPPPGSAATFGLTLLALAMIPGCQSAPTPAASTDARGAAAVYAADTAAPGEIQLSQQGTPVRVHFKPPQRTGRFIAALNGQDVTARFIHTADGYVFSGHRFPANAAHTPQRIDFWTGSTEGPANQSATFTPPALAVRGNVGDDHQSRVSLPEAGTTQLQLTLPQRVNQAVTVTLTPAPQAGTGAVALAGATAGRPVRVTFPAGSRVALVAARAAAPGSTSIDVSAPGYAAATLAVEVRKDMPGLFGIGADLRKIEQSPAAPADTLSQVPSE